VPVVHTAVPVVRTAVPVVHILRYATELDEDISDQVSWYRGMDIYMYRLAKQEHAETGYS
jgi:hypothetical protein